MDYTQALAEIKKGLVRPVYLLYGEETFLARRLENAIVDAVIPAAERDMSLAIFDRDPSVAELVTLVETVPFMGGQNIIIIRGTQFFRSGRKGSEADQAESSDSVDDRLLKLLADMPEYSRLVFMTPEKADKRRKIYKAVEQHGAVVDFSPLKPRDVRPWITAKLSELGCKMTPDGVEYLLAAVSMMSQISLGFLDAELEKIALYTRNRTVTRKDLISIMSAVPEVSVFGMIEALSAKQAGRALKLLEEQFAAGENAIRLLALLARQVRLLSRARELDDQRVSAGQAAEQLGVPPFVGEKLLRQGRLFAPAKLRQTIVALAEADRDLKSGRADKFVLEKIIIDMCR